MVAIGVLVIAFFVWWWIRYADHFIDRSEACPGCGKSNSRGHLVCSICDRREMILLTRKGADGRRIHLSCGHCHVESDGLCECGRDLSPQFTRKTRWWWL
jgi:hypothetical protein